MEKERVWLSHGVLQLAWRGAAHGNWTTWKPHQANAFTIPNMWQVLGAHIPGVGKVTQPAGRRLVVFHVVATREISVLVDCGVSWDCVTG